MGDVSPSAVVHEGTKLLPSREGDLHEPGADPQRSWEELLQFLQGSVEGQDQRQLTGLGGTLHLQSCLGSMSQRGAYAVRAETREP